MSCCKTKILYQSNLSCECVSLYQSTHTHPVPNGQCKCKSRVRAVGVVGVMEWWGCPGFFAIVLREFAPGFSLFSFSFDRIRPDSTGFSFDQIWQILTNFDHDKKSKLSTLFDTDIYRQISTFPMSNFDKFRPSSVFDKFRPIPTNSLFLTSHYYYMPIIQKVYLFLIDIFRACSPFFFELSIIIITQKFFIFNRYI